MERLGEGMMQNGRGITVAEETSNTIGGLEKVEQTSLRVH